MSMRFSVKQLSLVAGLFMVVFVTGADSFIISPLLPAIQASLHVSLTRAAVAVTVYAVCYAVGSPLFGPLGDRFGRKRLLLIGLSVFLLGSGACAVANSIGQFDLFRAVAGLGAALTLPNVWATVGQTFRGKQLNVVMGMTMAALSLSIAIGVPLGTWCAQLTSWRVVFWLSAGLAIVAGVGLWSLVPRQQTTNQSVRYFAAFRRLVRTPRVGVALLITLAWMFGFYTLYTFLGTFVTHQFALSTGTVGLVFTAYGLGNFLTSFISGWVTARLGTLRSVIVNAGLSILMVGGLMLTSRWLSGVVLALIGLSVFQGLGVPALSTYLVNLAPKQRGTVMAFNSAFLYLGLTLGSAVGSGVYTYAGLTGLGLLATAGFLIAMGLATQQRPADTNKN